MSIIVTIIALTFIALAFAYYFIQKDRIRRKERREKMKDKQQELLERIRSGDKDEQADHNR